MCLPCNIYPILGKSKSKSFSDEGIKNTEGCVKNSRCASIEGGICIPANPNIPPSIIQVKNENSDIKNVRSWYYKFIQVPKVFLLLMSLFF